MAAPPTTKSTTATSHERSEAFGYSLMMSVWNIGMSLSAISGSWLFERYYVHFMQLVWLNARTTALALLAVPLLPRRIVDPREQAPLPSNGPARPRKDHAGGRGVTRIATGTPVAA